MYDYFRGILERIDANVAIIDVNGIGYRVNCSLPDIGALSMQKGKEVKLFLHLVHKEDSMSLYGFLTEESRRGYEALLKVGGIGPRTALNMLSRCNISTLAQSIENDDVSILKKIPGIGEKSLKFGGNTFLITVTAEDGSKKNYVLNITRPDGRSKENNLNAFEFYNYDLAFNEFFYHLLIQLQFQPYYRKLLY